MKKYKINFTLSFSILLGLGFLIVSGCSFAQGTKGDGNVVKQERSVSSFSGIDVGGAFEVILTQGDSESLVLEADENLLGFIDTEVRGSTLKIKTTKDINDFKALIVHITFKDLKELEISGACNLSGENTFKLGNLEMDCSGASDIALKLAVGDLNVDCSGASQIDLYGSADALYMDISGASGFDASDLEVKVCDADISGASHAKIFVTGELSADVSGAGSLKYKGDAVIKQHDVSGAGSMKKI